MHDALTNTAPETLAIVVGMALLGLILAGALIAASIHNQRRLLRARRSFAVRLITAQDEERAAISRELHDDVVGRISAMVHDLRTGEPGNRGSVISRLDRLGTDIRNLARGMHPSVVDFVSLNEVLMELARSVEAREGLLVEYHGEAAGDDLEPAARLSFYRLAQEALGNVARHAEVSVVRMALYRSRGSLVLEIIDRGRGVDTSRLGHGPGIGLQSMRERIEGIGGQFSFTSAPDRGTRVSASLPLETVR